MKPSIFMVGFYALCLVCFVLCDDELDGHTSYHVYHSLEPSSQSPVYELRGIITYDSSRNEAVYSEEGVLSPAKIDKLKKLAESDDIYRIKLVSKPGEPERSSPLSFTKACAVYESGLTDSLTLALDQNSLAVGISIAASPPYCTGSEVNESKLLNFNTSVNVVALANGPSPDTLTYIQRLEQEKAEKARGEQGDNRSFLSKYWMYIIPFVLFLLISGASNPEAQGGGGGR